MAYALLYANILHCDNNKYKYDISKSYGLAAISLLTEKWKHRNDPSCQVSEALFSACVRGLCIKLYHQWNQQIVNMTIFSPQVVGKSGDRDDFVFTDSANFLD